MVGVAHLPGSERRVAYAISRTVGGAVVRNRIRRRLRAMVTDLGADLPPGDWLVTARPDAAHRSFLDVQHDLHTAISRVTRP